MKHRQLKKPYQFASLREIVGVSNSRHRDSLIDSYNKLLGKLAQSRKPVSWLDLQARTFSLHIDMGFVFIRHADGQTAPMIVACGQVTYIEADPGYAIIDNVVTHEDHQHRGLDSAVLDHLRNFIETHFPQTMKPILTNRGKRKNGILRQERLW